MGRSFVEMDFEPGFRADQLRRRQVQNLRDWRESELLEQVRQPPAHSAPKQRLREVDFPPDVPALPAQLRRLRYVQLIGMHVDDRGFAGRVKLAQRPAYDAPG